MVLTRPLDLTAPHAPRQDLIVGGTTVRARLSGFLLLALHVELIGNIIGMLTSTTSNIAK